MVELLQLVEGRHEVGSLGLASVQVTYDRPEADDWSPANRAPALGHGEHTTVYGRRTGGLASDRAVSVDLTTMHLPCGNTTLMMGVAEFEPVAAFLIDRSERGRATRQAFGWADSHPGLLGQVCIDGTFQRGAR